MFGQALSYFDQDSWNEIVQHIYAVCIALFPYLWVEDKVDSVTPSERST